MEESHVIQVNYWKELHKELDQTIGRLRGLVLLTHNSVELEDVIDFLNKVRKEEFLTLLYVSLINTYGYINDTLEKHPLHSKRVFVVDCVSRYISSDLRDTHKCIYRDPPRNLDEMKNLILGGIEFAKPDMIVVDSLSQFVNFSMPKDEDLRELYRFLSSLRDEVMGITLDTIILLYDDKLGVMKKLPTLFVDTILKLEVIRESPRWQE